MSGYATEAPEKARSPRAGGAGRSGYGAEEGGKSSGVPTYRDKFRRGYIKKKGAGWAATSTGRCQVEIPLDGRLKTGLYKTRTNTPV